MRILGTLMLFLLPAGVANAGVCDYGASTIGPRIILGASSDGVVDPLVTQTMVIRGCLQLPVAGATVVLTFTNCTNQDIRLCNVQPHHPGGLFNCAAKTVTAVADADGVAIFRIAGSAFNPGGNAPGALVGCATVQADGIALGSLTVSAADQNGIGGVTAADLSSFAGDRYGFYRGRSDFNGDNAVTVGDLAVFAQFRFSGGSTVSCAAACP